MTSDHNPESRYDICLTPPGPPHRSPLTLQISPILFVPGKPRKIQTREGRGRGLEIVRIKWNQFIEKDGHTSMSCGANTQWPP